MLQRSGFEIVCCEELTFEQQVWLFREAETVIGPHGGGFANLVWCQPGTKVLEILGSNSVRRCYWSICSALGLRHHCGVAEQRADNALRVDPMLFAQGLDALTEERGRA
jgi:capsular polysaccharide biosynthesis protein